MEQIYYTQCPMGYGLGASNGFQIKRLGAGYPPSGDVRHLALRAFLPGSNGKAMAPGTLRYRRVGTIAEVAWLEPRAREYETERGQWGRPGGHLAHGLRLDPAEMDTLAQWPAGLFGRPFWRRSDPEPSRGRRPDDLTIRPDDLLAPPDFEHVSPLIDLDANTLARLLAALAEAVRSNRALFLIDDPTRLGPRVAALTFAFPSALRPELTFSTYHDRPEELSGFRIQGTSPSPLVNRGVLAGLGPIADLAAGRFEPATPPPEWAVALATWLTRRLPGDAADWTQTDVRAKRASRPDDPSACWSDSWLDGLVGQADLHRGTLPVPTTDSEWRRLASRTSWASASGLAGELVGPIGPSWWRPIAREASRERSAHEAFWALVLGPSSWSEIEASQAGPWGVVAARLWGVLREHQREQVLSRAVRRMPDADRLARFLDGLLRSVPAGLGQSALAWLEDRGEVDPVVLLPLRARVAVGLYRERGRTEAMDDVLSRAIGLPDVMPTVLDLIADEATRHEAHGPVAELMAGFIESAGIEARLSYETWALRRRQDDRGDWLAPIIRRLFATEINRPDWDAMRDRTPPALRPALAVVCLEVASGPGTLSAAFLWVVEDLLLGIPTGDRPSSPSWVETYLERIGSPLELALRRRGHRFELADWLDEARTQGRLSPGASALRDDADALGRLIDGKGTIPSEEMLTRLPSADRAPVLGSLIDHLAGGEFGPSLPILERCARSWSGAFDDGAEGRTPLADPLATLLLQFLPEPDLWLRSLGELLDRLVEGRASASWSPIGIAASILAATCRMSADAGASWSLRSVVLRDARSYPILSADIARDLLATETRRAGDVGRRWDLALDKGNHTDRFFEVLLNACDGPRLAVVVPDFAAELWTLGALSWWPGGDRRGEAPIDLREGFATLVPMAPLASSRGVRAIEAWLTRNPTAPIFTSIRDDPDVLLAPGADHGDPPPDGPGTLLSERAQARWECIRALTAFHWEGKTDEARWADLMRWRRQPAADAPPTSMLGADDRYDFLAGLLLALGHPGADSFHLESLARWVARDLGLLSRGRIASCLEAAEVRGIEIPPDRRRLARDLAHQVGLQGDD